MESTLQITQNTLIFMYNFEPHFPFDFFFYYRECGTRNVARFFASKSMNFDKVFPSENQLVFK
jgi:hypothetical protein